MTFFINHSSPQCVTPILRVSQVSTLLPLGYQPVLQRYYAASKSADNALRFTSSGTGPKTRGTGQSRNLFKYLIKGLFIFFIISACFICTQRAYLTASSIFDIILIREQNGTGKRHIQAAPPGTDSLL